MGPYAVCTVSASCLQAPMFLITASSSPWNIYKKKRVFNELPTFTITMKCPRTQGNRAIDSYFIMRPSKKQFIISIQQKRTETLTYFDTHVMHPNLTSHDKRQLNREYFKTFFLPVSPLSSFAGNRVV
jgi:hypothetical protein